MKHLHFHFSTIFWVIFTVTILTSLVIIIEPSYTGLVIYEEQEQIWDFSNSEDYIFNEIEIMLENGAKLKPIISFNVWEETNSTIIPIYQAYKGDKDKTNKVISIDDKKISAKKDKTLNIYFEENFSNGDIIKLYLKKKKKLNIYLCDSGVNCNFSQYGSEYYDNSEHKFVNITLSNLNGSKSSFSIGHQEKIKVDYIEAEKNNVIIFNETFTNYTASEIETKDYKFNDFYEFNSVTVNGSGNLSYYHSFDSGENWIDLLDLEMTNQSQIKFKVEIKDNESIVYSIQLNYTGEFCNANWTCSNYSECINGTMTCLGVNDSNSCSINYTGNYSGFDLNCTVEEVAPIPISNPILSDGSGGSRMSRGISSTGSTATTTTTTLVSPSTSTNTESQIVSGQSSGEEVETIVSGGAIAEVEEVPIFSTIGMVGVVSILIGFIFVYVRKRII